MNLYQVWDDEYERYCFVFDISRNRAKAMVAEHFGLEYISMRCKTLKKGVNFDFITIVESDKDEAYNVVLACGYRYYYDEEEY
jgi:hypothetical protein